jgi:hypothetical protein
MISVGSYQGTSFLGPYSGFKTISAFNRCKTRPILMSDAN